MGGPAVQFPLSSFRTSHYGNILCHGNHFHRPATKGLKDCFMYISPFMWGSNGFQAWELSGVAVRETTFDRELPIIQYSCRHCFSVSF